MPRRVVRRSIEFVCGRRLLDSRYARSDLRYVVDQWHGLITSAGVPRAIVTKLSAAIAEGLKSPDVAQRFSAEGSTPVGSSPEHFSAHIQSEIAKWRKLVKDAGLALH